MRNIANMLRQTPYATSTPIASEQSTEHTNINESLKTRTLNLIFMRPVAERAGIRLNP